MSNSTMDKYSAGFGLSLVLTSLLNAVLLVAKETTPSLMNAMKSALGHHWITHGVAVIVTFVVLGFVFSGLNIGKGWHAGRLLNSIIVATVASGLVVAGFFIVH